MSASGPSEPRRAVPVDVYVAVGSNVRPEESIRRALDLLGREVELSSVSTFYRTAPIGRPGQPEFLNGVVRVRASLSPREFKFRVLRRIEADLGRVRTADLYAPRTIDLDIVLYGDEVVDESDLKVPPDDVRRPFVALPLLELAGDGPLPGTDESLSSLCPVAETVGMRAAVEFTREMKERLTR